MLDFRGDLSHYVEPCTSINLKPRVSIVVEQYRIAPRHYYKVTRLWSSVELD